jgi:hypothetical protein
MSNSGLKIKDEALREVAFGSITGSYAALGAVLAHDAFIDAFTNASDANIYVSFDGVTDHKKFAANSGRVTDLKTNDAYRIAGTQIYVKHDGSAPTSGWFAAEVQYT